MIGHKLAINYNQIFPWLKDGEVRLGINRPDRFIQPDGTISDNLNGLCRWFTNLPHCAQNKEIVLRCTYNEHDYPKFDWFDAINVDKVTEIPKDYYGVMGVPITFLDKFNPHQFEILDLVKNCAICDTLRINDRVKACRGFAGSINGKMIYSRILIRRRTHD